MSISSTDPLRSYIRSLINTGKKHLILPIFARRITVLNLTMRTIRFFAQLPPGDYEVTVSHLDKKEAHRVNVDKNLQTIIFDWK